MTRKVLNNILFLTFFLGVTNGIIAQKGWEAGIWLGTSHYFGDLNTTLAVPELGLAGGLQGRYMFNNRVGMQFFGTYARVGGDDKNSDNFFERARNLNFKSNILEVGAMMEFNFLPYYHGSSNYRYTPYLAVGFSGLNFNPKTEYDGESVVLRDLGTEGQAGVEKYKLWTGALVYGLGFKYNLDYYWSLNFQISSHRVMTDYLDDVSTVYPDMDQLATDNGALAVALSDRSGELGEDITRIGEIGRQRGNSKDNDNFAVFGVSLVYWFGGVKCPDINKYNYRD